MAEEFFKNLVEQVVEIANDERDDKVVLSKEDMQDIIDSLLNNDGLWQDLDTSIREEIYFVTGKTL